MPTAPPPPPHNRPRRASMSTTPMNRYPTTHSTHSTYSTRSRPSPPPPPAPIYIAPSNPPCTRDEKAYATAEPDPSLGLKILIGTFKCIGAVLTFCCVLSGDGSDTRRRRGSAGSAGYVQTGTGGLPMRQASTAGSAGRGQVPPYRVKSAGATGGMGPALGGERIRSRGRTLTPVVEVGRQ